MTWRGIIRKIVLGPTIKDVIEHNPAEVAVKTSKVPEMPFGDTSVHAENLYASFRYVGQDGKERETKLGYGLIVPDSRTEAQDAARAEAKLDTYINRLIENGISVRRQ